MTIKQTIKAQVRRFPWLGQLLRRWRSPANFAFESANSCRERGEWEEAIAHYHQAIAQQADWAAPYLELGNLFTQRGQFPEALENYNQAIARQPDWGAAYFYRGNVFQSQRNYAAAIADYQRAIELHLDWPELYLNCGKALAALGTSGEATQQWEKLIAVSQRLLAANSECGELYFSFANWLAAQGKYAEMEQSYHKAIALKPDWAEAYLDFGNVLTRREKLPQALENYNRAIALKPDWAAAYFYRGNARQRQENYEEAIADYQKAIELGLDWPELYVNLSKAIVIWANSLMAQNQLDKALTALQQALKVDPDNAAIYLSLGHIFAVQGDEEQMFQNYQQAIALQANDWEIYEQIGRMLEKLERSEAAFDYYQTALKLRPDSAELQMNLGSILLRQHQNEEALAYYQKAIALKPDWLDTYTQAGIALFLGGKYDQASEIWHQGREKQRQLAHSHNLDQLGIRLLGKSWLLALGHIAFIDAYIKMCLLGWQPPQRTLMLLTPQTQVPNQDLLDYWKPYLEFIDDPAKLPVAGEQLKYITDEFWAATLPDGQTKIHYRVAAEVQQQWEAENRPPLLTLSPADRQRGGEALAKLGVPPDAWFVSLHVREPGFHQKWNQIYRETRDANIDTYLPAIEAIVERGGWVIRLGDPTMKPLPPMKQVIDYAYSDLKNQWLDIFLCAACRFFVGTNSGLCLVPPNFGVPCLLTNWAPMGVLPYFGADLFIPKLYWSQIEERYLSFAETIAPPIGNNRFLKYFEEQGIELLDNTAAEIEEVTREMLDRLEGKLLYSEAEKSLQQQYQAIAIQSGAYQSSPIGKQFLAKYAYLLS